MRGPDYKARCETKVAEIKELRSDIKKLGSRYKRLQASHDRIKKTDEQQKAEIKELRSQCRGYRKFKPLYEESKKINADLEAEIKMLQNRNAHDGGSNSPPSSDTISAKANKKRLSDNKRPSGKKQGGQKGHRGATNKPEPTKFKKHKPAKCPKCGGTRLKVTYLEKRTVTDTPEIPEKETTQHTICTSECLDCGRQEIKPETGLPREGQYGPNAVGKVVKNYISRLPARVSADSLVQEGIPISSGTVHNITKRAGSALDRAAKDIIRTLIACTVLHIDETQLKLNGKPVWVWIFADPFTGRSAYVIRDSRGLKVLQEILGDGWKGTIVCDGWRPYTRYRIQRCWAHITREMRNLKDMYPKNWAAWHVEYVLSRIYADALRIPASTPKYERRRLRKLLVQRTRRLARVYADDPVIGKFMGKLDRASGDLFQFVLDPRIPSTNNAAERGLREIVVHRKIRGSIRSRETMQWMGNLFTCVTAWKAMNRDYLAEIVKRM